MTDRRLAAKSEAQQAFSLWFVAVKGDHHHVRADNRLGPKPVCFYQCAHCASPIESTLPSRTRSSTEVAR
jgi:hypothetical protein